MKKWIKVLLIILVVLVVLYSFDYILKKQGERREKWKEENCGLIFSTYTYNVGCAGACSVKCYDNGFPSVSVGYFEPYLSAEEMSNLSLYKRCACNCGGCRK